MMFLMKALISFFALIYIHVTFSQTPATCLNHVKEIWPRDGVLRVEILRPSVIAYRAEIGALREKMTIREETVSLKGNSKK